MSIFYESRLAKVNFNEAQKVTLDEQFEELTEDEELTDKQKFKSKWTRLEAIVGDDDRVAKIAEIYCVLNSGMPLWTARQCRM